MLHRCCCCCSYTQRGGGTRAHITEYARVPSLYDTATLTRSTMVMIGVYGCNIRGGYCDTATLTASTTWRVGKRVLGPTGPGQSPPTCACECMTMKRAAACTRARACGLTAVLRMMYHGTCHTHVTQLNSWTLPPPHPPLPTPPTHLPQLHVRERCQRHVQQQQPVVHERHVLRAALKGVSECNA